MQNPILIIGASGIIGSAIARKLSSPARSLILHGRKDNDALLGLATELNMPHLAADLSCNTEANVFSNIILEKYTRLSGIVFCAARPFPHKLALRTDWHVYQEQIDSQLKALHSILSALKPALENHTDGSRVIVLSTEYVLGMPPQKIAPYIAAKAALTAYCKIISQELLKVGIRVHIVAPGLVKSALTANLPDEYLEMIKAEMPERSLTSADDVANVCEFLLGPAGDPLYGTIVPVSRALRR